MRDALSCILNCIFGPNGGGGASGIDSIDTAAGIARNRPDDLTDDQLGLLRIQRIGIFFANENAFDVMRQSLWECIAECIGFPADPIPDWFTSNRRLGDINV